MNYKILLALPILFSICVKHQAFSQQKKNKQEVIQIPEFPIDESNGLITYSDVVEAAGSKNELYKKALKWFNTFYKNPANVIKSKDETDSKINGKPKFRIYIDDPKAGVKSNAGTVLYNIDVQCKDGRFKYDISKFIWVKSSPFPIEKWIEETNKKYNHAYASYLLQTDEYIRNLIDNLIKFMTAAEEPKPTDW